MRRWNVFMVGGLVSFIAAMSIVAYNIYDENRAGEVADDVLKELEVKQLEPTTEIKFSTNSFGEVEVPVLDSEVEVPDYILNPKMDMPETIISGEQYVGTLEIPKLNRKLPVMSEWNYDKLKVAPCCYSGSVYLNNLVILAHNYKTHFGKLGTLGSGDAILFRDMDGNEFNYEVIEKEVLRQSAVEQMKSGDWDLTLFTCTLGGKSRLALRCAKIN